MFISILLMILIVIFAILTGYSMCNKQRLESEERCLELSKNVRDQDYKIGARDKIINKQTEKLIMKDEYLKEIVRAVENNTYNNDGALKRKIKELAETAIKN